MSNSDQLNMETQLFYERFSNYTDTQILEVLRNQKNYRESARNAAVQIAIERKLIQSETDLLAPEFQNTRSTRPTLFPHITDAFHYKKLFGSTFRFLYVLSFLPIVYGLLKYAEGIIDQTILGFCVGAVWILLIFLLQKTRKTIFLAPLFVLLFFVAVSVGFKIAANHPVRILDFTVLIIGTLLTVYFLMVVKTLFQNKPDNLES
jgi:hypothetical protein